MRRKLEIACAHELTFGRMTGDGGFIEGPSKLWVLKCRLFGHKERSCDKHAVRWCERCGVDLTTG